MKGSIHIGTSGWSYRHWRDIFYPAVVPAREYLGYYAQFFDTVEVNTSFYHLPRAETVSAWAGMVPNDFRFCPKMSRYVTHMKKLHDPVLSLAPFFEVMEPLRGRLGPVLIQLPPSLAFHEQVARDFFDTLCGKYSSYTYALEVRHSSWTGQAALRLLDCYQIALVISQSGAGFPYVERTAALDVYVRCHGPGALYASAYSDPQLEALAARVTTWVEQHHRVWIYFNNDVHGYAVTDALRLRDMLGA